MSCRLAIVVPCYNEEEMLPITTPALLGKLDELVAEGLIDDDSYVLYVNDGSKDKTWDVIEAHHANDNRIKGLKLAGNVGHQFALTAGLITAKDS